MRNWYLAYGVIRVGLLLVDRGPNERGGGDTTYGTILFLLASPIAHFIAFHLLNHEFCFLIHLPWAFLWRLEK